MSGRQTPRLPPNEEPQRQKQSDYPTNSGYQQSFKHGANDLTFAGTLASSSISSHLAPQYQALETHIQYPGTPHHRIQQEAQPTRITSTTWDNQNTTMATYSSNHLSSSLPTPGYTTHYNPSHYAPRQDIAAESYNSSVYDRQLGNGPYNGPNASATTDPQAFNSIQPQNQQVYQPYSGYPLPPIQHAPTPGPVSRHLNPPFDPPHYQHTSSYTQTQPVYNIPPPQQDYVSSAIPRMTNHPYTLPPPLPLPQTTSQTQSMSSFDIGRSHLSPVMPTSNYTSSTTLPRPDQRSLHRNRRGMASRSPPSLQTSTSAVSSPALAGNTVEGEGGSARHKCLDAECIQRAPFSTYGNLRRHVREQHQGTAKKFSCEICDVVFTRATARDNHQNQKRCKKQHRPGVSG